MFKFLKAAVSFLFGGNDKASQSMSFVQESVAGIGEYIDEQKLTDQEAAEFNMKKGAMVLEAIKATRDENSTRSVTRRVLAWAIVAEFLLLINIALVAQLIDPDYAKFILQLIKDYWIGELTLGVAGFYFLANVVRARN